MRNIFHYSEWNATKHLHFTTRELDVLVSLAGEWLHYQFPPKVEKDEITFIGMDTACMYDNCALFLGDDRHKITSTTWLGDSGANCHMCNDSSALYAIQQIDLNIPIGVCKLMKSTKMGKLKVTAKQSDGRTCVVVLHDIKHVQRLAINLFSITKALQKN